MRMITLKKERKNPLGKLIERTMVERAKMLQMRWQSCPQCYLPLTCFSTCLLGNNAIYVVNESNRDPGV